jgi:hypothetical protein
MSDNPDRHAAPITPDPTPKTRREQAAEHFAADGKVLVRVGGHEIRRRAPDPVPLCNPDSQRSWATCDLPKGHDGRHASGPLWIDLDPDPVPREPERRPPNVAPLLAHMDSLEAETSPVHAAERQQASEQ